jgi:enoyl-CoA hydratase/carnithine racemase
MTADAGVATLRQARVGEHVLEVVLDRPHVMNALDTRMAGELIALFEAFQLAPGPVRCIVLTGAGERAFCAGADLKERAGISDDEWRAQHAVFERALRAIVACPVPIVAAVNGVALGGGCEIAAACDFVYAATTARFAFPEATLGIMPGMGGTQTLARAMGARRAKELLLTGRAFGAAEAFEWGLVNRVVEPSAMLDTARATASAIAANAPVAVRQIKQAIDRGAALSLHDALAFEIEAYNRTVPTDDRREGVRAFHEKRKPVFTGR